MNFQKNLVAFATILRKEVVRFLRIWPQTLLPPVINQSLYFIIFGAFIGSQIANVKGIPYMAFIIPGLVMMAVVTNSFTNVVSSFFGSKFQRNVEELMVSPTSPWVVMAGYVGGGVLRAVLTGFIVFLVSAIFVPPVVHNVFVLILFILLTASAFSIGGLINAIFANKFDDVSIIPTFVLTPLTYFAGVFYSIQSLPPFWQEVSKFNPILYMVDGFRYGFYGIHDVDVWFSAIFLIILNILLAGLCLSFLKKGKGLKS
jgi:ABC-2 type transport system permease protein